MQNLNIEHSGPVLDFTNAGRIARDIAKENHIQDPTIMAWHQNSNKNPLPYFDGANTETWWQKYGSGNGGTL